MITVEVEDAREILRLYSEHADKHGKGAFQYKNKVVDLVCADYVCEICSDI